MLDPGSVQEHNRINLVVQGDYARLLVRPLITEKGIDVIGGHMWTSAWVRNYYNIIIEEV